MIATNEFLVDDISHFRKSLFLLREYIYYRNMAAAKKNTFTAPFVCSGRSRQYKKKTKYQTGVAPKIE